jgi:hypothetical protein
MKKEKKKFKDSKAVKWITNNGIDLLKEGVDIADDYFPPIKLLTNIIKKQKPEISEDQIKAFEASAEAERKAHIEELKIHAADRESARRANTERATSEHSTKLNKNFPDILGLFVILCAVGFGAALLFIDVPPENKRLIEMFADIFLFAGAIQVLNYVFGSTKGSKRKTEGLLGKVNNSE